MEITKNTKVDWLLNYKAIKNQIQTADLALKTKINNRTSTLTYDMTNGFLSANYTLGGKTTYYNTANTLITNYTAVSDLSTALVTNMTDAAIDKQTEELEELIRILTGEIETLEADIKNLTSEYNSNYTKISNTSKGKSVSLSNYYITNAGGSITVTWTISDSTRNYALNSITSAYKDSSTGVITKKQAELDEYTTEKTKAENKIKEIAPEKSTYNKEGSGNGSTDDYDDRGYKKNPDAGSNNDDKTSANKDEGETHSKGDKVYKDNNSYTVIGYVKDDDGNTYGIYEDSQGRYYYYDKDGKQQRVKAVTKLTIPTKDGDTLERNADNESENSLVYQQTGETFEGYKIGDKVYKPSDISDTGSDASGVSTGTLKAGSNECGTVTNPDTGKTTTIYEDKNGWYYYIDENGNKQNVKANMITDTGEQVQKLASDESVQGINDINYKETFDSYEIDGQKYTADQVNTNVKGITIDNAQVGDKFEYNGTNYKVKTGTVNGTTQNVYDAGIFGGYYYKDDSGNLVKIREAAPGEYVTE